METGQCSSVTGTRCTSANSRRSGVYREPCPSRRTRAARPWAQAACQLRVPPATDPLHSHHLHKDDIEVFILFPNTKDLIRNSTARWSWGRTEKEKKKRIHSFELVKIRTHFNEE